ncbi:SusC/RagA family TonB-linked outer membrane protein [Empedobacter sp. UBA7494]|uniref:SusC/RagA family TonB-linked outer membrane protein n=1 Tax=Empedobacter sp. UBA7494 TaxID=1946450 RepID=UPI0025C5674A|nr:SusC/RagA family TonB-linked outer membrane protein [Empedobacter sp. UBA7494]
MRRNLKNLFVLGGLLLGASLYAQEKTVTGTVTDSDGLPVADAVVKTTSGKEAYTDENGMFSIEAKQGDLVTVEAMGLPTQSFAVGAGSEYKVTLKPSETVELEGAVVTAMGITREKKSLGYASQKLDADQINSTPTNNFLNNLSGKVAGLEVKANSNFGGSTNIVLRGAKSITGNNQALIVVDGVPINNSNLSSSNASTGRSGFDFGNSASDMDPNNIESINVLKGAAATVLYGSEGANGVIMITTKKGKKNQALGITLNSTVSVGEIDKSTFAKYQDQYGAGYNGEDDFTYENGNIYSSFGSDGSYGPRYDPSKMVYQWNAYAPGNPNFGKATPWQMAKNGPASFFQNSYSYVNSVNLSGGSDISTFNFTFTNNNEKGTLPNSKLNRNIINGNYSYKLADNLTASTFMTFTNQNTVGRNSVGYSDNVLTGFRQWWPTNVDIRELKQEYFRDRNNITWNINDPANGDFGVAYWNNPYWDRYENYEEDWRTRVLTGGSLSWDVTSKFNILGRVTVDYSHDRQDQRKAVGSHAEEFGVAAADETSGYWVYQRDFLQTTYDLIARYTTNISDRIGVGLVGGYTYKHAKVNAIEASTTGGLVVPGVYSLSNTVVNYAPIETRLKYDKLGVYAQASFDLDKTWFLEGSVRNDQSTAIHPDAKRSYWYYSFGTSLVLSELIKADWINFMKVRASYAVVGNDPVYGQTGYRTNNGVLNGNALSQNSSSYVNVLNLKPENTKSWEVGFEGSFAKRRVNLDLSFYKTNTTDLIFNVPQSTSTGYTYSLVNAGETENKGIEVSLNLVPIRSENFQWDMTINWAKNKNKVISLNEGRDNLQLASFQATSLNATVGEAYGTIRGIDYTYDANGNKIVDADGYYVMKSDQVLGNIQADWTGGIHNKFRYKNVTLGFLVDVKKGGSLFSLDQYYGQYTGLYPNTVGNNDLGNPLRNPLSQGGGVILPGVKEGSNGVANDVRIDRSHADDSLFPHKEFVYDASYVKLREVSLSYVLPEKLLRNTFVKGASFSLLGNNLWIIHKNVPYADPEAGMSSGNIQGYQSGVMPTTRVYSFNVKFNF